MRAVTLSACCQSSWTQGNAETRTLITLPCLRQTVTQHGGRDRRDEQLAPDKHDDEAGSDRDRHAARSVGSEPRNDRTLGRLGRGRVSGAVARGWSRR